MCLGWPWCPYLSWGCCTCGKSYSTSLSKQTVLVLLDSPSLPGLLSQARSCPASVTPPQSPGLFQNSLCIHLANKYLLGLNCVSGPGLGTGAKHRQSWACSQVWLTYFYYVFYKGSCVAMGHGCRICPKRVFNMM